jgi:hypothetical protein
MTTSKIAAIARLAAVTTLSTTCLVMTLTAATHAESGVSDATSASATASLPTGAVTRAVITNGVDQREPVDQVGQVGNDQTSIVFFTELRDLKDQEVTHRWTFNGQVMAEVPFQVGGERWRVWSTKQLQPIWLGSWQVDVVAKDGTILESQHFDYIATETADTSTIPNPAPPASPGS